MINKLTYYPTSEDFLFIAKNLIENPTKYSFGEERAAPRISHFLSTYDSDDNPIYVNGIRVLANKIETKNNIKDWISRGCPNPPKININNINLLSLLYYEEKPFIFKFNEYFRAKGFDVMEMFSELSSENKTNYQLLNLFSHYISYINTPNSSHQPKPENIFKTIERLNSTIKKYAIPHSIGLLLYCTKHPKIYPIETVIDLTATFTNGQKNIPQAHIKKYETLLNICEKLNPTYWKSVVSKNSSLKNRLQKKDTSTYEVEDCIARNWTFDSHNLSSKNGGFSIKIMKENFNRLYYTIKQKDPKNETIINFFYQNESSNIKINLVVQDSFEGKKEIEKNQTMIEIIFQNCCKNNLLSTKDIQNYWDNLNLMSNLEENLSNNNKPKIKNNKI
jgi:hypothetical protein